MTIKTFHHGFTLPTLLIISTVLMIMGAAVLQGTISVKNALDAQFYNQIAREAAEAGLRYAQTCLSGGSVWSELRPNTTCTGSQNGAAPDVVLDHHRYRTTFRVQPVDQRADGSTQIVAQGITQLLRPGAGDTVYQTFTETLGEAAAATSANILPDTIMSNQNVDVNGATYMLGYDQKVYSMGSNAGGQLGDGTSTNRSLPVDFKLPDGVTAKKVVTGSVNTFVLGSDGKVYGAGDNANGQLGNGTTNNTSASNPVVFEIPSSIFAIDVVTGGSGAGRNTFVLGSNGRVYGAGTNQYNQLHSTAAPTGFCSSQTVCHTRIVLPAPDGQRVKKMATTYGANNNSMLVVIAENGAVYGRGRNNQTQLGGTSTSDTTNRINFTQITLPSGVLGADLQTGYYNTYILGTNGQMYGFGQGSAGQMGNGGTNTRYNTAQRFALSGSLNVQKIAIGTSSNAAETDGNGQNSAWVLASDHQVYGAGQNHNGQLGNGNMTNQSSPVRFNLPSGLTAQDVSALYFTTCVLTNTKQVYCAGSNKYGQLGIGNTTNQSTPQLFPLPNGVLALKVTVSYDNVFVLGSDGNVYGAGRNNVGQLGDGTTTNRSTPVVMQRPVAEVMRTPRDMAMMYVHTSVFASDGNVYSSGYNGHGQFGDNNPATRTINGLFRLPSGYAYNMKGAYFGTYVLSSDAQLYGAGQNDQGQLGIGNTTNQSTPVKFRLDNINPALTVRDFAVATSGNDTGNKTTLVHASDNQVYGVGLNEYGQLGNGSTSQVNIPSGASRFQLPSGVTAKKLYFARGGLNNTTFVLGSNNILYGAGRNSSGQLGNGSTTTAQATPVVMQLPAGVVAMDVSIGLFSTYILGSDGNAYATGYNNWGQLGDGTTTMRTSPVVMNLPSGVKAKKIQPAVSQTSYTVYVLGTDGQLYGAGRNVNGQLGRGTADNFSHPTLQPVQIPSGLTVVDFWAGQENVLILASNGKVYGAGRNNVGQLGTGDTMDKLTATTEFQLPAGVTAQSVATQFSVSSDNPYYFTGVIGSDGKLYVAGDNAYWQLGATTPAQAPTPIEYNLPDPPAQPKVIF